MVQIETKRNVSSGTSDGLKKVIRPSPLQVVGSQQSGKRFGVQTRKPKTQDRPSGCGRKSQIGRKRKSGHGN